MKIEYETNKILFEKNTKEFYSKLIKKPFCIIFLVINFLLILFLIFGIFNIELFTNKNGAYFYAILCVIADFVLMLSAIKGRAEFVKNSVNNFYNKYKEASVIYNLNFVEDCFTLTNNINDDKLIVNNFEVKKVVETINTLSILYKSTVLVINKQNVTNEQIEFIKNKYKKNKK